MIIFITAAILIPMASFRNIIEIILLLALPFLWGMVVEHVFEKYRRWKPHAAGEDRHDRLS